MTVIRTIINLALVAGVWALITNNHVYQAQHHTQATEIKAAVAAVVIVVILNIIGHAVLRAIRPKPKQTPRRTAADFRVVPAGRRGRR